MPGSREYVRGCSWLSPAQDLRVSYRNKLLPDYQYKLLGFRLVERTEPVVRGGSWDSLSYGAVCSYRYNLAPRNRIINIGFRLKLSGE